MTKTELETFWDAALTPAAYRAQWELRLTDKPANKEARKMNHYRRYNMERTQMVESEFLPSAETTEGVASAKRRQKWLVLTEDWCGDSAFLLPVAERIARDAEHIELRILPRDENLDLMDQHLTNGGRSIPKLLAFDAETAAELFTWGPRPDAAAAKFLELKATGIEKPQIVAGLVDWYAQGGWKTAESELALLVQAIGRG